ncbi:unnamed protein product [Calicophoron daubneyi]|uniref:Transmembrane protein n=1 Tax=Calicophoron daubneyi TaxID=300641 RepID=A0AAV2TUW7_CALDB
MDNVNTELNSDRAGDEGEGPGSQLIVSEEGQPTERIGSSNFETANLDSPLTPPTTSRFSRRTTSTYESRATRDLLARDFRGEESYALPANANCICGPSMIMKGITGKATMGNALRRLQGMSSVAEEPDKLPKLPPPGSLGLSQDPRSNSDIKLAETGCPTKNQYRFDRHLCCWATIFTIIIVLCAIATIFVTILTGNNSEKCVAIEISLVPTSVLTAFIVGLEWTRTWLWRGPKIANKLSEATLGRASVLRNYGAASANSTATSSVLKVSAYTNSSLNPDSCSCLVNTGSRRNLYDVPQFVSALVLILLYSALMVGIAATTATSAYNTKCTFLAPLGLIMSSLLAVFVVIRIMMCCLSDVCQGLCYRTTMMFTSSRDGPVPMLVASQLDYTLAGLKQNDVCESGLSTAWLYNIATTEDPKEQLSITTPMPVQYSNNLP